MGNNKELGPRAPYIRAYARILDWLRSGDVKQIEQIDLGKAPGATKHRTNRGRHAISRRKSVALGAGGGLHGGLRAGRGRRKLPLTPGLEPPSDGLDASHAPRPPWRAILAHVASLKVAPGCVEIGEEFV